MTACTPLYLLTKKNPCCVNPLLNFAETILENWQGRYSDKAQNTHLIKQKFEILGYNVIVLKCFLVVKVWTPLARQILKCLVLVGIGDHWLRHNRIFQTCFWKGWGVLAMIRGDFLSVIFLLADFNQTNSIFQVNHIQIYILRHSRQLQTPERSSYAPDKDKNVHFYFFTKSEAILIWKYYFWAIQNNMYSLKYEVPKCSIWHLDKWSFL